MSAAFGFMNALPDEVRASVGSDVLDAVARAFARAAAEHPGAPLDDASFGAALAARWSSPPPDLESLAAGDLALVDACARGETWAIARFDQLFGPDIDRAIAKSPNLGVGADELRQLVREKLFVAEADRPPRIAAYSARGPLRGWVRVTVSRMVLDLARRDDGARPAGDASFFDRVEGGGADPETAYLRSASRATLEDAMKRALSKLSVRERNLLRQRFLFDLPGEKIAVAYGVHRATAFGWIEDARKALLREVQTELNKTPRARGGARELESLLHVLGSRLELSLRGVLGQDLEEG
ncbi:MAG: hypothetical protein U0271_28250 [Polyangiaceae bacterium]